MKVTGSFEVKLEPQQDSDFPVGRMLIRKEYSGDLNGVGIGQMLSKRTVGGTAAYSAIEEFSGTVSGKKGTFTLIHNGLMTASAQKLDIYVLPGSGTEDLENITGSLDIIQENGAHRYLFSYEL